MNIKSLTLMVALALPLPALPQEATEVGLVGKVHSVTAERSKDLPWRRDRKARVVVRRVQELVQPLNSPDR